MYPLQTTVIVNVYASQDESHQYHAYLLRPGLEGLVGTPQ